MKAVIRQSLRFSAVGVANTAIGLAAIYAVLYFFGTGPVVANATGYAIGLAVSFSLNRAWTFDDTGSIGRALPRYLSVAAGAYLLNLITVLIGARLLGIGPYLVQLFGVAIYTVVMFLGCRWFVFSSAPASRNVTKDILSLPVVMAMPLLLALYVLEVRHWDLSVPLIYTNADDIWQLVLTKALRDTGWVLTNPFLGAPGIASWHHNAAAQTSALHSVLMSGLSFLIDDAVKIQQLYYLLNFSLISLTSFVACRLLGIARLPAICVGLLFAFTTFRINEMLYAFLSNYFMVPLALVPVIWIMTGVFRRIVVEAELSSAKFAGLGTMVLSREFVLGLIFIVLMALSDGYYAFFTLLLLGFAMAVRMVSGDLKSPLALLVPIIYIASVIAVSLALIWPLYAYKKEHIEEFSPQGIPDPALLKHPFEAEVYSTTLKMLVAPHPRHRIEPLAELGRWMVETSDGARLFKNERNLVPLGTLGSILFAVAMICLAVPAFRTISGPEHTTRHSGGANSLGNTLVSLALYIFFCSIVGGIGTLVALVFPTIRAYDRFPLFLIFVLLLGGAHVATGLITKASSIRRRLGYSIALVLVTSAALYDQIPRSPNIGDPLRRSVFLAERDFVKTIEASLPAGAMIYQYPYSQYLRNSKHYGWGAFSHVRLYLHSTALRWSNGAAKNSPVENWHFRLTVLPLENLLNEIEAVGFAGLVIDRSVVPQSEYERLEQALAARGAELVDHASSGLAFAKLKDNGFRIEYDASYREAARLIITDKSRLSDERLSVLIDERRLGRLLAAQPGSNSLVVDKSVHPEVFLSDSRLTKGQGVEPVLPLTDMKGEVRCSSGSGVPTARAGDTVILTLENRSSFDWKFDQGPYPIRIGVHMRRLDDTLLRWDDGFRVATAMPGELGEPLSIPRGSVGQVQFRLSQLNVKGLGGGQEDLVADFRIVQDGHAWFEQLGCKVLLKR
jgi:putative flippase GtrA